MVPHYLNESIKKSMIYNSFTSGKESQSIVYLLSRSELIHIYWILYLEIHNIRFLWTRQPSRMQRATFFWSRRGWATFFGWVQKGFCRAAQWLRAALALTRPLPQKAQLGCFKLSSCCVMPRGWHLNTLTLCIACFLHKKCLPLPDPKP